MEIALAAEQRLVSKFARQLSDDSRARHTSSKVENGSQCIAAVVDFVDDNE